MKDKICIVIPAYNAAETIGSVVSGALQHVSRVLVADDGSSDATAVRAAEAGATVLRIAENHGKGHALKLLFQRASEEGYTAVITVDADGQHDTGEIPLFMQAHQAHPQDIIVGSRMHETGKIPRPRYNSMQIARFYVSLAANQFIEDTQCGFRLYPLAAIKNIELTKQGYVTETEILMKAGDSGVRIRSMNINTIYNNTCSYFRPILDVADITQYVISYLIVKWFIEGFLFRGPCTYRPGHMRDFFGRRTTAEMIFQPVIVLTYLPLTLLYLAWYGCSPLMPKKNFASLKTFKPGFFMVVMASQMLPVLLCLAIAEKLLGRCGCSLNFVDGFIRMFWTGPHEPDA